MGAMEAYRPSPDPAVSGMAPPHISLLRKLINIIGCLVCLPLYSVVALHCRWPVTLDLIITIALAELNRYVNEGRRMAFYASQKQPVYRDKEDPETTHSSGTSTPLTEKSAGLLDHKKWDDVPPAIVKTKALATPDVEKMPSQFAPPPRLDCMAAVVGWREDPGLFTRALESYRMTRGCSFLLVGIDGDEAPDHDMVDVFNKVYPHRSTTIHVSEPLGEIAQTILAKEMSLRQHSNQPFNQTECETIALQHCVHLVRTMLRENNIHLTGPDAISQLCIRQRHMHKKGVMFTTYIFALVIADTLGIEFLWSSDSDTLVSRESLLHTVDAIASDAKIGGASSGLVVHNGDESVVTRLAETVYWGELYLTRSTPAATATSDCQSGPSTVFRLAALPAILVPWYMQTIFGKRMVSLPHHGPPFLTET
jgi:hyaluronan synthase